MTPEEYEYGYAEVYVDTGDVYVYAGSNGEWFSTYEEAWSSRIEDTDVVLRRRKAGDWERCTDD